ncbi:MAG: FAD:protein FMN transferase [Microbacterium sp.]
MSAATDCRWDFAAIGTVWRVDTPEPLPAHTRSAVRRLIDSFDAEWSRFREDSLISELARGTGSIAAPPDATAMLDVYAALSDATAGAVNPLVGDVLAHRGYDAGYGFVDRGPRPARGDWRARLRWDERALTLAHPSIIDVGALGKGRLVDRVAALLRDCGVDEHVVDASGDLAVRGRRERVALEHPYDATRAIGVWEVEDAALCASATQRRAWTGLGGEGLHHVLDARTGVPVRTIAATWAVAKTAMIADGVATALFFDGGARLAHEWGVQWVRMTTDGRVEWSPGSTSASTSGLTSPRGAELFIRE